VSRPLRGRRGRFHTFRHTCASLLFAAGRNPKQVQCWIGHHSPSFTLDVYGHLLDEGTNTESASGIPLGAIPSPFGTMYLRSDAASAWHAMRQEALNDYGIDLYPEGPLGAYRTYDQQAELYRKYLNGTGALAAPPGTSEHNLGIALDLATPQMRSIVDSIGPAFGWAKVTAPEEWWHITYLGR
jgi:hypothetical protein